MLEVTNLAKSYPTPRGPLDILSGLSLSLRPGEAASIVGPSGSGKSTLLYILGALEPPTSGTVTLDGVENVLIATLVGDSDADAPARARDLLERVGLADRLDHRPAELSGGERQRVALARALIRRPPLLLCDEPTGNLDHAAGDVVATMLFDLHQRQETVLVVVTHNTGLAAKCPIRFELVGQRLERA